MSSSSEIERRISHGIGGAGNMHLPSVVKQAEAAPETETSQRRRSSVWSLGSSNGASRRGSIVDKILRRGSKNEEKTVAST
ncbi:hypothetical protein LTR56_012299 [Elasticomyces elasticus]|nr:hypothetical protein LTR56_012299 [Elasticomyces elasticus]KAK3641255.1 hypothetical protein LTR22_016623 [Elasticomyces elasticus]KAK4922584.1 hypothetical protein LTR49_010111 [Elasticomyces elasticus]KAK5760757.1 hypothetical protein LTS12_009115 [Elasticomyces elasticus]